MGTSATQFIMTLFYSVCISFQYKVFGCKVQSIEASQAGHELHFELTAWQVSVLETIEVFPCCKLYQHRKGC